MQVKVNLFAASALLYFFMISNISCHDKYHFSKQGTNSFYYKEMFKTLLSPTAIFCFHECNNMVNVCTHVAWKNVDHGRGQCTRFDARNGTREFFLDGVGDELWANDQFSTNEVRTSEMNMTSEQVTTAAVSDVIELNMEHDNFDGDAGLDSDRMVCYKTSRYLFSVWQNIYLMGDNANYRR